MKKITFSWVWMWIIIVLFLSCEKIVYDNPADIKGINAENLKKNPILLQDDDNDGIVNVLDNDFRDTSVLFRDTIKPEIRLVGPETVYIYEGDVGNNIESLQKDYKASDNNGPPTVTITHNIDYFKVNEGGKPYEMVYTAVDSVGNTSSVVRYVFVRKLPTEDTIPPKIILSDSLIIVKLGDKFVYPTVEAHDDIDGNISDKIKIQGNVDVNKIGTYLLTYTVQDRRGNVATATVKVIVKDIVDTTDLIPPVITLVPPETLKVPDSLTPQVYYTKYYREPGYSAIDNVDGDITSKVEVSQITSLSGSKYWFITYSVRDKAGNPASKRRYFEAKENIAVAPVIELTLGDSIVEIVIGTGGKAKWVEPGYRAYDVAKGEDITKNVIVDSSQLVANLDKPGIYSVVYTVTSSEDTVTSSEGVTTQVVRQVKVKRSDVDITGPVITLKGKNPDTVLVKSSTTYKDPGFTAIDDFDGDVTTKVSVTTNVNMNNIGKGTVTYSVVDNAGNRTIVTRTVWVVRDTVTSDLLTRYVVPSENPLPSLSNKSFKKYEIDGEHDTIKGFEELKISWNLEQKSIYDFAIDVTGEPYHVDLKSKSTNTFGSAYPTLKITNSGISAINGEYYVTYDSQRKEFIWVDQKGKYAIIWQE